MHQKVNFLSFFLYLAPLNIRVLFIHVSWKAKVRDLHLSSFSHEDISCCKVPVNKLSDQNTQFECLIFTNSNKYLELKRLIPSFRPGIACLLIFAMQRRSGHPLWVPCRLGSPSSWSFGWRLFPCSLGQLSGSHARSCGVTHTWHIPRWGTMDLFRETA